jgi:hypothetical protein
MKKMQKMDMDEAELMNEGIENAWEDTSLDTFVHLLRRDFIGHVYLPKEYRGLKISSIIDRLYDSLIDIGNSSVKNAFSDDRGINLANFTNQGVVGLPPMCQAIYEDVYILKCQMCQTLRIVKKVKTYYSRMFHEVLLFSCVCQYRSIFNTSTLSQQRDFYYLDKVGMGSCPQEMLTTNPIIKMMRDLVEENEHNKVVQAKKRKRLGGDENDVKRVKLNDGRKKKTNGKIVSNIPFLMYIITHMNFYDSLIDTTLLLTNYECKTTIPLILMIEELNEDIISKSDRSIIKFYIMLYIKDEMERCNSLVTHLNMTDETRAIARIHLLNLKDIMFLFIKGEFKIDTLIGISPEGRKTMQITLMNKLF